VQERASSRGQKLPLYYFAVELVSTYILAGGKSSRMGSDKAFLELNGQTLLERAIEVARTVTGQVTIVGDPAKFGAFGKVISDIYRDHGPLGGIHAALMNSNTALSLIIAVDLPFLETGLLKYVISQAVAADALVTVPFVQERYQPLCAVYRKQFAEIAEAALNRGRNKIDALFCRVPVRVIHEDELRQAGFAAAAFRNLNTPEEWERAQNDLKARSVYHEPEHQR
jgi:molybdopterin-guanine dinucleotide biosynthesis protein A